MSTHFLVQSSVELFFTLPAETLLLHPKILEKVQRGISYFNEVMTGNISTLLMQ
jgi:hypothetical protein